jgi:DNA-binding transcriptional LysR family regulator
MGSGMDWDEQRLGRHLKLRDLNVLLAVARCGSMGKAAAQLAVSQPAISKAIADMELTLGVRLLDRTPRGVEPTIYARVLLDHGRVAFDELRQAIKHIEHLADPTKGEVRIGSSIVLAEGFVASVVDRLSRRRPGFVFHLLARESGAIYRALEERKVDLAVLRLFKPLAEPHLSTEILYDDPHVVAAGAQNPWTGRRAIRLADLIDQPWVLPPLDSLTGMIVLESFRASGLEAPSAAIVTDSTPARRTLLASGRFVSIIPASLLKPSAGKAALKALPIRLPTASRPIGIVTLKDRTLSPGAEIFIKTARELARPPMKRT